ncbi:alpha/beta hydrolase [Ketobacter sp. MCCC 1A13808]|uniref:alpha/beta fold hydrolase n=1 Tax=Ketobacter sp. MCCC 1A13808 TaxID=2602738 RepID=UPI0012EC07A6|nr:alpha/beta hydrolase [Ketobacter sp. MCCC 1A13808]MVF12490.1 alpha/beta hydrolase [Ketobacter sp. MCCC 1A13808]
MLTEEIRINIGGQEIAAKQWGDAEKPTILALHGWLDNAASFDRIAPLLTDYRVVAMDFAGHGYSAHRPDGMRYHMLDNVDDAIGFADALELNTFILMGHSMGAGISSLLSGSFPERVEKLILIEGIGTNTSEAENAPAILRTAVCDMKKASAKRKPIYETKDEAIAARTLALGGISFEASATLCSRGLHQVEAGYTWRSDPRIKMSSAIRLTDSMVEAYLQALTMPVFLATGNQSFFAHSEVLQKRAGKVPHMQHVPLQGNHHLHLEPDTYMPVYEAINAFLNG